MECRRVCGDGPWRPSLLRYGVVLCAILVCLALDAAADFAASPARRGTRQLHHAGRMLAAKQPRQPSAKPDYEVYHRKDDLLKKVENIVAANPETMSLQIREGEDDGYKVAMQELTVSLGGLKESSYASKLRILMDFGEHGRELISSELGLRFIQTLTDPATIKAAVGGGVRGERMIHLLRKTVMKILPMENVGGRTKVENGQLCERKNGRGVDTNRNYEVDWGVKAPDYDPNEEYPGTRPYSEPEVQIVKDIATKFKPHVWLNVHSGMEAMFVPWDHKAEIAMEAQKAYSILQEIHRDTGMSKECVVGSGGKSVGYLAHGTATDFMFSVLKIPMSYTWEIYGDFKAAYDDCFRMFNPIGKNQTEATINLWQKAIFRLIELAPSHHAVSAEVPLLDPPTVTHTAGVHGLEAHNAMVKAPYPPSKPFHVKEAAPAPTVIITASSGQEEELEVVVDSSVSAHSWWPHLLFGAGGLAVVAFFVIRYLRSTKVREQYGGMRV